MAAEKAGVAWKHRAFLVFKRAGAAVFVRNSLKLQVDCDVVGR